jgi:hypothetical protein
VKNFIFGFLLLFLSSSNLWAFSLPKGTQSLAGDFEVSYGSVNGAGDSKVEIDYGYFFFDNFETGAGLMYSHNFDTEWTEYGIGPFFIYHVPLSDRMNMYLGLNIVFSEQESTKYYTYSGQWAYYDYTVTSKNNTEYSIVSLGLEPKITDTAVFDIGVKYYQSFENSSNRFRTAIGIKIFF